jgi:2-oxoglutarate dehydrogenase E2 component (dihydrolipoamide succinyltransferase)
MPTDVVMPQMGESIFEGTITKWLKKTGDPVQKDEPLFEISTDKVDAEIPSPVAGILTEIKVQEGATVGINEVVAIVSDNAPNSRTEASAISQPAEPGASSSKKAGPRPPQPDQPQLAPQAQVVVVMPQMGESIFEGTITKWLKKVGDTVQKDEPLFEISTDKVDAEIPAPVSGVLTEIATPAGETVQINTVVGIIGGASAIAEPEGPSEPPVPQPDGSPTQQAAASSSLATEARAAAPPSPASLPPPTPDAEIGPAASTAPPRSSPLVRRMARENNLDLRRIAGTGSAGRITKDDVLRYLADGGPTRQIPTPDLVPAAPSTVTPAAATFASLIPSGTSASLQPSPEKLAAPQVPPQGVQPMSRMRSIIAQRMVDSRRTSPHAYSVYKIDMTRIARLRESQKRGFEQRNGVKLTYMPFVASAVIDALRKFPILNSSVDGTNIRYHQHIHLGIAVALEWGLIVPVITNAEERSFLGLARAIADLAERARTKKLKPEEASGSTFTLTNSGVFGGEYGTPIINQPEAAILAIGGLRKEPAVLTDREGNDTLAIRSMQHLCIGFDHRIVDGADAGKFMLDIQKTLEAWDRELG